MIAKAPKAPSIWNQSLFSLGKARQSREIVNSARIDGTCGSGNEKRRETRLTIGGDRLFERLEIDAMVVVDCNKPERVAAKPAEIQCLTKAAMSIDRRISSEAVPGRAHARAPYIKAQRGVARDQDCKIGGKRGSSDEKAGGGFREAEKLPHPTDNLPLDFYRDLISAATVCVQACSQHLGEHPNRSSTALNPPHEARVSVTHGKRQHGVHELSMYGRERRGTPGNVVEEAGPDIVRDLLPHGTAANLLQVIEHVVDHAMALSAELGPILRVKVGRVAGLHMDASHTLLSAMAALKLILNSTDLVHESPPALFVLPNA